MCRNHIRCFLGRSDQRARVLRCEDFRVQSATFCFKQTVFTWEELTLLTYAWAWKTHFLSTNGPEQVLTLWPGGGPMDNEFCFLFCVKQYVPSVHWCCESFFFLEEHRLLWKRSKRLRYWQPHRCNCDQRWHKSSIHTVGGKNEVDTITQKNLMEHFWSNFNTRLIVFSWTHCCQDVNCFGIFFLFLFKT